jgi:molybdopterin molybdotransferase
MISVEEALEKILGYVNILEAEESPILDCLGQVLAEDVYSGLDVPPLDNAAMDGYAVKSADTSGASEESPRRLKVIDTVAAGYISKYEVNMGTAIRIMTGAPLPRGADSVVKFEDTDELSQRETVGSEAVPGEIGILAEAKAGLNVRRAGEDVAKGSLVLSRGTVIR